MLPSTVRPSPTSDIADVTSADAVAESCRIGAPRRARRGSVGGSVARRRIALICAALISVSGFTAISTVGGVAPAGAADDPSDATAVPGQRLPTRGPIQTNATTQEVDKLDLVDGLLRGVPIIDGDFADPYALSEPDALFIYATNTVDANIPVMELKKGDDFDALYLGDALPKLPSWTVKGFQWAPSVWARPDGTYVMYYTTPDAPGFGNKACISRATSKDPAGPFVDDSSAAFICPVSQGGAIDPSIFIDTDGTPFLLWKSDGNCCSLPTVIYSQQLTSDGLDVAAPAVDLITASQPWEGDLVEGPSMIKKGDTYYLFYSANNWNSTDYAIGAATCTSVAGPCVKPTKSAWMDSTEFSQGPGGEEFFDSPSAKGIWMVHHGWLPDQAGTPQGQRRLYLDRLSFPSGDTLPTRSDREAVEEALLDDAGFLALLVGLGIGVVLVGGLAFRHHRRTRQSI